MATQKGVRLGGRQKGTPNKSTQELMEIAERNNCNPFEVLIWFAKGDFEKLGYQEIEERKDNEGKIICNLTISPELRQKSAKDACEYLWGKKKAVELSFDQETKETYEEYLKSLNKDVSK